MTIELAKQREARIESEIYVLACSIQLDNPTITFAMALGRAWEQNKRLYGEYVRLRCFLAAAGVLPVRSNKV